MISIVDSQSCDDHLETYRQWVSREWEADHSFEMPNGPHPLPKPLLAMVGDGLAGGVSFTWHAAPESVEVALWINTLYVEPSCRGKGIASALITAAEEAARNTVDVNELLVYTNIPDLYARHEWVAVDQDGEMWVLRKNL